MFKRSCGRYVSFDDNNGDKHYPLISIINDEDELFHVVLHKKEFSLFKGKIDSEYFVVQTSWPIEILNIVTNEEYKTITCLSS